MALLAQAQFKLFRADKFMGDAMKKLLSASIMLAFLCTSGVMAAQIGDSTPPTAGPGMDISLAYLAQARKYRDDGRYELSRQSYAQALSTCRSNINLEIIKRELAGVELLIRTMR